jgi:dihydrolipoamide dehydrogenase
MADKTYDLVVIGGGPGGYVAAIRAAQLGMTTACVEGRGRLGGTCLNVGCIPSKALLHSSEKFAEATHGLAAHGIGLTDVTLDLATMMARKGKVVDDLTKGIEFLFKKNKIDYLRGWGSIVKAGEVTVAGADGESSTLKAKTIIIATGSESTPLPGVETDEKKIVTSTGGLELDKLPKQLIVIGAGVIGLELGSVWSRLGAEVTVIEFLDRILPGMDGEIAKQTQRVLKKQGLDFKLGRKVTGAKKGRGKVTLTVETVSGGKAEEYAADVVLVAIGRRPFTDGLGLEALGVAKDNRGFIQVDAAYRTNVEGIHAIGDAIAGPMLAHKAEEDGIACVEMLAGQAAHVDYNLVPGVVYTWPEVAGVGKTEEELKEAGVDPLAGDILAEAVIAMEFGGSAEDIARTCHSHPGMGEAVKEAALAVHGRAIHI